MNDQLKKLLRIAEIRRNGIPNEDEFVANSLRKHRADAVDLINKLAGCEDVEELADELQSEISQIDDALTVYA